MKKVWVGVGIGCGALLLIVIGVMVAGGLWVKSKVGNVTESTEKMQKQSKELASLDTEFPFEAPPEGQPVKLEKARVEKYFAVRSELLPVYEKFDAKGKEFEAKHKDEKDSFSGAMEAGGMILEMTSELRSAFIEGLKKQGMSPKEFHYTTGAIFSSAMGKGMAEMTAATQQSLEESVKNYEEQLNDPNLSAEEKAEVKENLDQAKSDLAQATAQAKDAPAVSAVHEANAKLLEPYKERIEKEANPALDAMLFGENDDYSNAMNQMGGNQN